MWFSLEYLDQVLSYIKISWLVASYRVSLLVMCEVSRYLMLDFITLIKFFSSLLSFLIDCITMLTFSFFMPILIMIKT